MDSLMAVELRNRLQSQLGEAVTLASTLLFDYPTIETLARHVVEQLSSNSTKISRARPQVVNTIEVEQFSANQINTLDDKMIDSLIDGAFNELIEGKESHE
jgi:hypothetical protein